MSESYQPSSETSFEGVFQSCKSLQLTDLSPAPKVSPAEREAQRERAERSIEIEAAQNARKAIWSAMYAEWSNDGPIKTAKRFAEASDSASQIQELADMLFPEIPETYLMTEDECTIQLVEFHNECRAKLLAIANELK